jgi:hypothetical protein
MECIFVEQEIGDTYRIAAIDRHRIFSASNPGNLATVFECSLHNPKPEDKAEIFHALATLIQADNLFVDLKDSHRSWKLNYWTVVPKDPNETNLFLAVEPLNRSTRLELYSKRHEIAPQETITSTSKSLFSIVAFSEKSTWKTGILQRCVDCLVVSDAQRNAQVYSVIDEEYRRIMRFKYETEHADPKIIPDGILISVMKRMLSILGLKNSHDSTVFSEIPESIDTYLNYFMKACPSYKKEGSLKECLSKILTLWSGAKIVDYEGGYQLEVESSIIEGLGYMAPLLSRPVILEILETPF